MAKKQRAIPGKGTVPAKPGKARKAPKEAPLAAGDNERRRGGNVDSISVRMYRHGFGDCFLLTFLEKGEKVFCMLVDCGMLTGNTNLLKQAVLNIKKDCGGRLDVVVQTHQHKDHISGFNLRNDDKELLWNDIKVDHVWLAWTENVGPDGDELAIKLRKRHNQKLKALEQALARYNGLINSEEHETAMYGQYRGKEYLAAQHRYAGALNQLLNFAGIGSENSMAAGQLSLTMEHAMNYFKKRRHELEDAGREVPHISFWNPGDMAEENLTRLGGIRFYFLGPPRDYNKLRVMEDKTHAEMYFTDLGLSDNFYVALEGPSENGGASLSPFHSRYFLHEKDIPMQELSKKENKDHIWNLYHKKEYNWRKIETDWLHNAGALALHMDSYTNNTSLAFAIEFEESGRVLLFPADAQIGNWISWTETKNKKSKEPKLQWTVNRKNGKETVNATQLLERTVFYKVGHHCSHNATARKHGLELMKSPELVAMIPVDEKVASRQGKTGWKMPARNLYERLKQKTKGRIIRLDKGNIIKNSTRGLPETAKPTRAQQAAFNNRVNESDEMITTDDGVRRSLYIEYLVEA